MKRNASSTTVRRLHSQRRERLRAASLVSERYKLGKQLDMPFASKRRDIYEAAGYQKELNYDQYVARYLRQDVARRVVNVIADDSWRLPPELLDGADPDTAKEDTEFTRAWALLAESQLEDGETRRGLLHYLHRLDTVSGIGQYGVLFLGLSDGEDPKGEAKAGSLQDPSRLIFTSVFDENSAKVIRFETDKRNPRYGRPILYQLTDCNESGATFTFEAHWTRCIHVADNVMTSDLVGSPRLQMVWNRLVDLDKIAAATGEAGWRMMVPGYVFTTRDGYDLDEPGESHTSQIDEFVHELRRSLELEGMDVKELAGQMQDPSGAVNVILKLISAGTGIPLRKLTGSEMGQLASGQDDDNWTDVVEARQQQHVTPAIIRPVVNRLLWLGVLPQPASGQYSVWWPSQRQKSQKDAAEIADRAASALQKVRAKVKPRLFAQTYLPDLPADAVDEEAQEQAPNPLLLGSGQNDPRAGQEDAQNAPDAGEVTTKDGEEGGKPATNTGRFRHFTWPVGYP